MKIMVISSLLRQSDEDILNEVGVDIVLPKPFTQSAFVEAVVAVKMSDFGKRSSLVTLRKIRALLASGNHELAESTIGDFLALGDAEIGHKREVEALWAYHLNDYQACVKLVSEALALGNNDASALTLMGRALLKMRDFKSASLFLERAQVISPNNIQRLLDLSDAQVGADNIDGAKSALEKAAVIDPTNEWVVMAECRIAIEEGDTQTARSLFSEIGSGAEITAQMNNRAIALAQMGKISESIGIYVKTLDSLPVSWKTQVAKVTYNLGMAYARNGSYEKSEQVLASVAMIDDKDLGKKAKSLEARIKQARESGVKLTFQTSDVEQSNSAVATPAGPARKSTKSSLDGLALNVSFRPGDICLYRIYVDIEGTSESARSGGSVLTSVKGAKAS
jgi:tetratricopeptide (TPR) repeat protein